MPCKPHFLKYTELNLLRLSVWKLLRFFSWINLTAILFSFNGLGYNRRTSRQREENEKGKEVENLMIHLKSLGAVLRLFSYGVTWMGYTLHWISNTFKFTLRVTAYLLISDCNVWRFLLKERGMLLDSSALRWDDIGILKHIRVIEWRWTLWHFYIQSNTLCWLSTWGRGVHDISKHIMLERRWRA